jgi:hypothetical protein
MNSKPSLLSQNLSIKYGNFSGDSMPLLPDYMSTRMIVASPIIEILPAGTRIIGTSATLTLSAFAGI